MIYYYSAAWEVLKTPTEDLKISSCLPNFQHIYRLNVVNIRFTDPVGSGLRSHQPQCPQAEWPQGNRRAGETPRSLDPASALGRQPGTGAQAGNLARASDRGLRCSGGPRACRPGDPAAPAQRSHKPAVEGPEITPSPAADEWSSSASTSPQPQHHRPGCLGQPFASMPQALSGLQQRLRLQQRETVPRPAGDRSQSS